MILLKELVKTDFKLRYKNSALGYVWSMLRPLMLFLVLYVVFVHFLRIRNNSADPAVYLLIGIVIWNFFTEVTTRSTDSIVARGDILRKINFPKYIIVVSIMMAALINLGINFIVVFIFMLFGDAQPTLSAVIFIPLLLIELIMFALGLGFILSSIFMKLRDVNYIWEVILQAGFYATPILYPITLVAEKSLTAAKILMLNPVAQIIQDFRYYIVDQGTMTSSSIFDGGYFKFIPILISVLVFALGVYVFRKRSKYFAEDL